MSKMKNRISALLLIAVIALCSCSTTPQESGQTSDASQSSSTESCAEKSEENEALKNFRFSKPRFLIL
jgi:starvation-inducible outer membrane lipoprotein